LATFFRPSHHGVALFFWHPAWHQVFMGYYWSSAVPRTLRSRNFSHSGPSSRFPCHSSSHLPTNLVDTLIYCLPTPFAPPTRVVRYPPPVSVSLRSLVTTHPLWAHTPSPLSHCHTFRPSHGIRSLWSWGTWVFARLSLLCFPTL